MPPRTWILTDVAADRYEDSFAVGPADVDSALPSFALKKRTLRGGLRDGVDAVEIDNGRLQLTLLPTRGLGLWRVDCGDVRLGWSSPTIGPVHPSFVPVDEPSGIGWLRGFDEFLVRCGLEFNGAPEWDAAGKLVHPLHGRIANLPAHYVEASVDVAKQELVVVGAVDESRFFGQKLRLTSTLRTRIGTRSIAITDEVTNFGTTPAELELLYHINQGPPLCGPGSRFLAAVQTLVPKDAHAAKNVGAWQTYPAAEPQPEMVYFFELIPDSDGWAKVLLTNAAGDRGLALAFDRRQFPLFTLWKNPIPFAEGYVTGLEPCINLPHSKSFEKSQGRVAVLQPGETRRFDLRLDVLTTAAEVAAVRSEIERLQQTATPKIYDAPQPGWSP